LKTGLETILRKFDVSAVVVSWGLDAYDQDPCALRRAGFCLAGDDYKEMGKAIARGLPSNTPVVFLQEEGYRMDCVGDAAVDVIATERHSVR
jgi:acetoin utilization deacetylase AcuC-like enzyme